MCDSMVDSDAGMGWVFCRCVDTAHVIACLQAWIELFDIFIGRALENNRGGR